MTAVGAIRGLKPAIEDGDGRLAARGYRAGQSLGVRLHLDTDFAGDTDDAAALAMLLGWPGAELVGITTTADPDGTRAGYIHHVLTLAGREIPVASGAGVSLTGSSMGGLPDHQGYWGDAVVAPIDQRKARPSSSWPAASTTGRWWWRLGRTPTSRCWRCASQERCVTRRWL